MKLVYFDAHPGEGDRLQQELSDIEVTTVPEALSEKTVQFAKDADIVSVFVTSEMPEAVIEAIPNLKMIAARSAGYDHIDAATCKKKGVVLSTVPHYGETTVAEHAFALILALSRKVFQSYERTERMNFDREGLQGFDLKGKTLGVVGTGNIGKRAIEIGRGFSMEVIAYDVNPDQSLADELGFTYVETLDDLLSQARVITLHVPYIKETHHLINKENIKKITPGGLLVNTARGGLVETQALLWALEEGVLAGAGLDVLEEEHDAYDRVEFLAQEDHTQDEVMTLLQNHMLVQRDDVLITPHNAFNSEEAVEKIFVTTLENIHSFLSDTPQNVVG